METENKIKLTGAVVEAKAETTSNGKELFKLIVETDPPSWMTNVTAKDRTQVLVFGKTVNEAKKIQEGHVVTIGGRLRGREYNGRWYTDVIGESFKIVGGGPKPKHTERTAGADDDWV